MRLLRSRSAAIFFSGAAVAALALGTVADALDERRDIRDRAAALTGGDPVRGEAMFIQYGCGSCHGLKHVRKATGAVGPPLDGIAMRAVLAENFPYSGGEPEA